jgi:DNA-binding NarL/FixJ family response regulator
MQQRLRVMLADDHETVRQGLRALFASVPGIDVVEEVGDAESAIARAKALAPDLLVLDLSMPKSGGLAAIRELKRVASKTKVVVLTRYRDAAFVREALSAGAVAYVLKQSPFSELHQAVMQASHGERYIDHALAALMEEHTAIDTTGRVSDRERDVLRRSALGQSNKEIASALNIAVKTVEVHKTQGMRKLDLRDRSDLIRYATIQGWLLEP